MKIVLWIGNQSNQKALANKIDSQFPIEGIITETRKHKPKITFSTLAGKLFEKLFLSSIGQSWMKMKTYYNIKYPEYPDTKILDVENINSDIAYSFTINLNPDLIIVSGTRLVKEKLLSLKPKFGILNLHTGLSPYIKGGPNCTNWCIATKRFHLVGNTIMWIDIGIDTGNMLTTEFTNFDGDEDLAGIHIKVMEHAHALYLKAIAYVANGQSNSVKQSDIAKGKTYYTKQWGIKEKINLIRNLDNFRAVIRSGKISDMRKEINVVKI